jgi:mitochondrial fission protein ELM1
MSSSDICWVLTTGEAGHRSQALGLAEAVGLPIIEKRIVLRAPWSWLPGGVLPMPLAALAPSGEALTPPWPRLVIACGRRSIGAALATKRVSGGRTIAVYIQNPEFGRARFDLVVALQHDGIDGRNVVTVPVAPHRVTPTRLREAAEEWRERLATDGAPLLGVLLGGDNGRYRLTDAVVAGLIQILRKAHDEHGFHALLTPSRRTGQRPKRFLSDALGRESWARLWDERGDNPFLGLLALSDRLIVTGESISMISEALAAGSPVHVLPLEGESRRHDAFLSRIRQENLVSVIESGDLDWGFAGGGPINGTEEPAARLREMLAAAPRREPA